MSCHPDRAATLAGSGFGSAGITLVAILQNWSQAVTAWKPAGAPQMGDAANIRLVGAGIADRSPTSATRSCGS